jgi:hypothetical protein
VPEDDAAVRARLAALEAEVKAESATKQALKDAALERLREQKTRKDAERQALVTRQAAIVSKRRAPSVEEPAPRGRRGALDDLDGALELTRKARGVKDELSKPRGEHEKSWLWSGGLSLLLGPMGWLYAGSFREAVPASLAYLLAAAIIAKTPFVFVLMPAILVAMVLSGFVGIFYSVQYNRHGGRQRLFNKDKDDKGKKGGKTLGKGKGTAGLLDEE